MIVNGSAANASNRWGDYAALSVDPVDECTFWASTLYSPATTWSTRIAAFKFDNCVPFVKGDFNQDLSTDLLFRNNVSGAVEIWPMNGTTRASAPVALFPQPAANWLVSGADGFNGDNRSDLVLWNTATGPWSSG